jgi:gliding motility-associated-like protein
MFNWSNGKNTQDVDNLPSGIYTVTVTDSRDCSVKEDFVVSFDYELQVDAVQSTAVISEGESVQLMVNSNSNHTNVYSWSPAESVDCPSCSVTYATPSSSTLYSVSVIDLNGCHTTDTLFVEVKPISSFFIPNTFTPNKDGANDVFELHGDKGNLAFLNFAVFNRWGEKVFESSDHQFHWDGTYQGEDLPAGPYTYVMKAIRHDASRHESVGSITILR